MKDCDDKLVSAAKAIKSDSVPKGKRLSLALAISRHMGPENDTNNCSIPSKVSIPPSHEWLKW